MEVNPILKSHKIELSRHRISEVKEEKTILGRVYCLVSFEGLPVQCDTWINKQLIISHIQKKYKRAFGQLRRLSPQKAKRDFSTP